MYKRQDEARAHGEVQPSRARLSWVLARAYSAGNSDIRLLLKYCGGPAPVITELCKIPAVLLLSPFAAVIFAASPNRRLVPSRKICRAAGKLTAIFGARYNEYAVIHGE